MAYDDPDDMGLVSFPLGQSYIMLGLAASGDDIEKLFAKGAVLMGHHVPNLG